MVRCHLGEAQPLQPEGSKVLVALNELAEELHALVAVAASSFADIQILNLSMLDQSPQDLLDRLSADLFVPTQIELAKEAEDANGCHECGVRVLRDVHFAESQSLNRVRASVSNHREEVIEIIRRERIV